MNGITVLYFTCLEIRIKVDLNSWQTVGMNCQAPHDGRLHYQSLHVLLNFDKIPLELYPVTSGQPEVHQDLFVHLD